MTRPTFADISLSAVQHNLQRVKQFKPNSKVMAMVKANAYGHGLSEIVNALDNSADRFGVCCLEEALIVRQHSQKEVMLVEGFFSEQEIPTIIQNDFIIAIHSLHQIEVLEKIKLSKPIRVFLKINTGMNRLGVAMNDVESALQRLTVCENVVKPFGLMTHFASADLRDDPSTELQASYFQKLIAHQSGPTSMANSAAIMAWPAINADWVRPGIMLYGASPFADTVGEEFNLKPVMTLRSEIIALQHCQAGDKIGYGATYECKQPMTIGVVAIGYGDGYPRHAPNGTPVLVGNTRTQLVGRVSMDMITVDCSQIPNAHIGMPVVLWGEGLPIELVANVAGTISYELTCGITPRVVKRYSN